MGYHRIHSCSGSFLLVAYQCSVLLTKLGSTMRLGLVFLLSTLTVGLKQKRRSRHSHGLIQHTTTQGRGCGKICLNDKFQARKFTRCRKRNLTNPKEKYLDTTRLNLVQPTRYTIPNPLLHLTANVTSNPRLNLASMYEVSSRTQAYNEEKCLLSDLACS